MKRLFAIITAVLLTAPVFAQVPQKMSYQAVIRDALNHLVTTQVGMQISILKDNPTGTSVYVETQTPTTNINGLVTIEIGGGTLVSGNFSTINWANGTYYIKTETDPTGGTNYTISGTSQILSVPYALHAKTATNFTETDPNAVILTGNQTVAGNKTFTGTTTVSTPVNATDAATKAYADAILSQLSAKGAIVADADGNIYSTVRIGSQIWMAENLRTTKFRNGDLIGTTTPATLDITGETSPKYQWAYNGNESNVTTYGRLYTWYAVTDTRNVCPTGWHMPSDGEWTTLENFLIANMYNYDGTTTGNKYAKSLASTSGWTVTSTTGAVGNTDYPGKRNATGFTALPGGYRDIDGTFGYIVSSGIWWSATESDATTAWSSCLDYSDINVTRYSDTSEKCGFSVRCVRD
jgi:uncharacterized protein (TIGR02145 family)